MTTNITIKKIDERIVKSLKKHAAASSLSLNEYVKQSLARISGLRKEKTVVYDDLNHLAGTWSEEDAEEFHAIVSSFESIDEEMWLKGSE